MIKGWLSDNPFWNLEQRRLALEPLVKQSLLIGAIGIGLAMFMMSLVSAVSPRAADGLWIFLGIMVCAHLVARGWLQSATPSPHFERDARSGNLEQFRLLPVNPHQLILQRGLPLRLHRACALALWMPGYALWGSFAGMPLLESLFLWAIFSFVDYLVLAALSFFMLFPFAGVEQVLLFALVGGYSWMRERSEGAGSKWVGLLLGLIFGLSVIVRLLFGQSAFTLPDLRPFFLVWLCVEGLRYERLARWLNDPQGLWQWFFLLPMGGIYFLAAWLTGQWAHLQGWNPIERLSVSLIAIYAMGSGLQLYFCQINRSGRPLQQRVSEHQRDTLMIRSMGLFMSLIYCGWAGQPPSSLNLSFWVCFLLFSAIDAFQCASLRSHLQKLNASRFSVTLTTILLGVLSVPALLTVSAKGLLSYVSLTLPSLALLSMTPLWKGVLAMTLTLPPTALSAMMMLRALLIEGLFRWLVRLAAKPQATRQSERVASLLIEFLFIFPLLHRLLFRNIQNPVIRFLTASQKRTVDLGFFFSFLVLSLWLDWMAIASVMTWGAIPLTGICWYLSYRQSFQRMHRLLNSGEFRNWLITPLSNNQLYWGIIYSGWLSIWKGMLAIIVGILAGQAIREMFITGRLMAGAPAIVAAGLLSVVGIMALLFALCVLLVAAPSGVNDALTQAKAANRQRSASHTLRAVLLASLYSILTFTCCIIFAPLALIALPVYSSNSMNLLNSFRRAPDDRMFSPQ